MGPYCRVIYLSVILLGPSAYAYKTSLSDNHNGLSFSAAYILPTSAAHDPVSAIGPQNAVFTGASDYRTLEYKLGLYRDLQKTYFELYGVYLTNSKAEWTVSNTFTGSGKTVFTGKGVGANLAIRLAGDNRFRLMANFNAEYLMVSSTLDMANLGILTLSTTSTNIGAGLRADAWLGDLWTLSLVGSYLKSLLQTWTVVDSTNFMGINQTGTLKTIDGTDVSASYGGFLAEVCLHLSFY